MKNSIIPIVSYFSQDDISYLYFFLNSAFNILFWFLILNIFLSNKYLFLISFKASFPILKFFLFFIKDSIKVLIV